MIALLGFEPRSQAFFIFSDSRGPYDWPLHSAEILSLLQGYRAIKRLSSQNYFIKVSF